MADWIGRTLSKVEVLKLLGRGGMAEVYLGRHSTLNRPVAVKILHAHLSEDDSLLTRFRAEAQSVAGLRHPNIVQVFDFDVADDRPYIVMELLEGLSLAEYLRALRRVGRTLPLETTGRLITPLASALDYAHERGIVHRDIKPANVMLRSESGPIDTNVPLSADTQPILTDFGVARIASATARTASGVIIGTPSYMSPEQVRGEAVDWRSDIYSLGIMLYEMLAGTAPFESPTDTPASILVKHITEPPPPLPDASPALQAIVDRALAKDREERYQKAGDLAADLQAALASPDLVPVGAQRSVAPSAVRSSGYQDTPVMGAMTRPGGDAFGTVQTRPARAAGFNPLWAVIGGVAGLIVLAVVLGLTGVFGGRAQATPEPTQAVAVEAQPTPVAPEPTGEATAELISESADTAQPSPETPPTADLTTPRGVALFRDAGLVATLRDLEPPPDGFAYEAWLTEPDAEPLSLGVVEVTGGQASVAFIDPAGGVLLSRYSGFALSVEPLSDSDPAMSGTVAYAGQVTPEALQRVRLLDSVWRGAPLRTALLDGLPMQAKHYDDHLGFAVDGLSAGSLPEGKMHAEHVINIIVGSGSPDYSDWNGDGRTENPGDAVGLRPYLSILSDAAQAGASAPGADPSAQEEAASLKASLDEVLLTVEDALRLAQRIASADTLEEAQSLAAELDTLRVQSLIAPIVQQAEALDPAIGVEVFAVAP